MKIRITGWWWMGLILIALLGVALWDFRRAADEIRTVSFADGTTVRLVGVTYGTNHVTASTALGRMTCRLPKPLRDSLLSHLSNRRLGVLQRVTATPTLMLWLETSGPSAPGMEYRRVFLQPAGGNYAGAIQYLSINPATVLGLGPQPIDFTAIPHRSQYLELALFGPLQKDPDEKRLLRFLNPAFSSLPPSPWVAAPLPATAQVGDLKVTLLGFTSGLRDRPGYRDDATVYFPTKPGDEPLSLVQVAFESPRGTNETWALFGADLSDEFGNMSPAQSPMGMISWMSFNPILWDEGRPWRLRLHLKRTAGFLAAEQVVFSNVPLPRAGESNRLELTNESAEVTTVLQHFIRRPEHTHSPFHGNDPSELRVEHSDLGTQRQFGIVQIVARPSGTKVSAHGDDESANYHTFRIHWFPRDTTHLDLTFSLQPTRYVEFIVNPNWVTNKVVVPRR